MPATEAPKAIDIPSATDDPAAYQRALLEVAGDQEPVEAIATTPARVRELCGDLTDEQAGREPEPGEWSAREVIGHLFDVDIVYGFRWRLILTEENPSYPGYDEKGWAPLARLPLWQMINAWESLRAANVALLRSLTEEQWQRVGRHGEQGEETIEVMARKIVGHDIAHVNQLARALHAIRG